jgi:hypothetical protein
MTAMWFVPGRAATAAFLAGACSAAAAAFFAGCFSAGLSFFDFGMRFLGGGPYSTSDTSSSGKVSAKVSGVFRHAQGGKRQFFKGSARGGNLWSPQEVAAGFFAADFLDEPGLNQRVKQIHRSLPGYS